VLIDEIAAEVDIDDDALALLRTRRNTANKLRMLLAALGLASPDHRRLRALGRSRDCLFHCGGMVRRADSRAGSMMTTGWSARSATDAGLMAFPLGSRLRIDRTDIEDICRFYDRLADDLLSQSQARRTERPIPARKSVAFLRD
jgi:hypothetical protein